MTCTNHVAVTPKLALDEAMASGGIGRLGSRCFAAAVGPTAGDLISQQPARLLGAACD